MDAHKSRQQPQAPDRDNVIQLWPHQRGRARARREALVPNDLQSLTVDIRGNVTFGRLMDGLASVGLTVRMDARSGRVVITDDASE
jgi:hypothetical protein